MGRREEGAPAWPLGGGRLPPQFREPLDEGQVQRLPPDVCERWFGGGDYVRVGVEGSGSCFYQSVCAIFNVENYLARPVRERKAIGERFRARFAEAWSLAHAEDVVRQTAAAMLDRRLQYGLPIEGGRAAGAGGVPPAKATSMDPERTHAEVARELADPKAWAREAAVRFVSSLLGVNLIFIDQVSSHAYCGVHRHGVLRRALVSGGDADEPTGIILWTNGRQHFEPVARLVAADGRRLTLHTAFKPWCHEADRAAVAAAMAAYADSCSGAA